MARNVLPSWWTVAMQFGYFLGLAFVVGGALTYLAAVRPGLAQLAADLGDVQRDTFNRRGARQLRYAAAFFLVTAWGLFATELTLPGPGIHFHIVLGAALTPSTIWAFVSTPAGADEWASYEHLVVAQNVLFGLAIAALLALGSKRVLVHLRWVVCAAIALTVLGSVAAALPTSWTGETTDDLATRVFGQLHILAGASWVGGLGCLALLTHRHRLGGAAGMFWAGVWQRFSVLAMTTVAVVLTSGIWLAWKDVGSPAELVTTPFGRFLIVKITLVALLVCAGGYNQLILTPRLVNDARANPYVGRTGTGRPLIPGFPRVVIAETVLGCGVLVIVPFLTSSSARAQAGSPPAPALDLGLLTLSGCLVATLAASLYATHRIAAHLVRRATATPG